MLVLLQSGLYLTEWSVSSPEGNWCIQMTTSPISLFTIMNDTTTEPPTIAIINTTVTTATTANLTDPLSCNDEAGVTCSIQLGSGDPVMCTRLAPPPVPPWLEESPSRLHELTKHCRSWTLYHELCQGGRGNSTLKQPRQDITSEVTVLDTGPAGIQWVIPALAMVVVLLLMVLAAVMYKHYRRSSKRRMYRVAGSGRPFKLPQTTTSWASPGGPLVESETMESYLCQQPEGGADTRYIRSPVCRLLEQIQYVATPTEDQTRPRGQSGPAAFTSPAYFLPSLSWLRLPVLQHAWPGESCSGDDPGQGHSQCHRQGQDGRQHEGQTPQYDAGRRVFSHNGEVTHQWPARIADGMEDEPPAENEPEYSEIWEGGPFSPGGPFQGVPFHEPPLSHYSSLSRVPYHHPANQHAVCECQEHEPANGNAGYEMEYIQRHFPDARRGPPIFAPNEHRYEKLWPCGDECGGGPVPHAPPGPYTLGNTLVSSLDPLRNSVADRGRQPVCQGSCEHGWLSKYKLPSPCFSTPEHAQRGDRGMFVPNHTHSQSVVANAEEVTSDSELLPECSAEGPPVLVRPDRRVLTKGDGARAAGGRVEVKYRNPTFEGQGPLVPSSSDSGPGLTRLWGFFGIHKR